MNIYYFFSVIAHACYVLLKSHDSPGYWILYKTATRWQSQNWCTKNLTYRIAWRNAKKKWQERGSIIQIWLFKDIIKALGLMYLFVMLRRDAADDALMMMVWFVIGRFCTHIFFSEFHIEPFCIIYTKYFAIYVITPT